MNAIQKGDVLSLVAPYDLTLDQGVKVGQIFGVARNAALTGQTVEVARTGVFTLTALNTSTGAVGALAYWDNSNRRVTNVATSNLLIGVFAVQKTSGPTVATVLLDGTLRPDEAGGG